MTSDRTEPLSDSRRQISFNRITDLAYRLYGMERAMPERTNEPLFNSGRTRFVRDDGACVEVLVKAWPESEELYELLWRWGFARERVDNFESFIKSHWEWHSDDPDRDGADTPSADHRADQQDAPAEGDEPTSDQ